MSNDKEERMLHKAKISLMRTDMFALFSGVLMVGKSSVSETFPTACTDGRNEIYGRKFVASLTDKELAFVVMHENLHKAFKHLTTWRKLFDENALLCNAACDYVINLLLVDLDPTEKHIAMPHRDGKRIGLLDRAYKGMHAKQVFNILKKKQEEGGGKGNGAGPGGSELGEGDNFDEHDWEAAAELSEEDKKTLTEEIDRALRQGQIAAKRIGAGAGGMDRVLDELLAPKIDWREALREFVKSICSAKDMSSWRKINRRFLGENIYLPTLIGEKVGHLAVGIDTSGSIGGPEIARFLSEVKSIAEDVHPEKIDLMYWDCEVARHEEYDMGSMDALVSSTKPRGGGGTDPTCMMRCLKEKNIKPECIIMLTDGYIGNWGDEWEAPILWVVVGDNTITAPVGKTVRIED